MLTFQAIVDGVRTLKDGGLKVTLETQEISAEDCTKLFSFRNLQVHAGLNELPIQADQLSVKDLKPIEKGEKTPGQRLRGVIYRYWEQTAQNEDPDLFYKRQMEHLINLYKQKLD